MLTKFSFLEYLLFLFQFPDKIETELPSKTIRTE